MDFSLNFAGYDLEKGRILWTKVGFWKVLSTSQEDSSKTTRAFNESNKTEERRKERSIRRGKLLINKIIPILPYLLPSPVLRSKHVNSTILPILPPSIVPFVTLTPLFKRT
jgi:hypothetical protein